MRLAATWSSESYLYRVKFVLMNDLGDYFARAARSDPKLAMEKDSRLSGGLRSLALPRGS